MNTESVLGLLFVLLFLGGIAGFVGWWLKQPGNWDDMKARHKAMTSSPPPLPAPVPSEAMAPAGWYANPSNPAQTLYWNGASWGTPQAVGSGTQVVAWFVAILSFGYMLPWAVAASRQMPNHGAIALLNVLAGWTGVGWIIALVMAAGQARG